MKNNASPNRRLMITKNSIMMLVMLVIIFLAIWAWYYDLTSTYASTTVLSAGESEQIELALPEKATVNGVSTDTFPVNNSSWKTTIEFNDSGYLKNLVKDITSDGKQYVVPNFQAAAGLEEGRKVIPDDVWTDGLSSKEALTDTKPNNDDQYNYVSLDFYARSKNAAFRIKDTSYLAAGSELGMYVDDNGDLKKSSSYIKPLKGADINTQRISSYGASAGDAEAFSADAIVGAMRVSIVGAPLMSVDNGVEKFLYDNNGTTETHYVGETISGDNKWTWDKINTRRLVWLPRPDLFLKTDDDADNWRLFTGLKPSGNGSATLNGYAEKTYCHDFYKGMYIDGSGNYVESDPAGEYIKKRVDKSRYYDANVKPYGSETGVLVSNPDDFRVSKDTSSVGGLGKYPTLGQSQSIAGDATSTSINFTKDVSSDQRDTSGYYVYKYTLNLWIEGEDAEARRSMDNGLFSLYIEFGT